MSRYDVKIELIPNPPKPAFAVKDGKFVFETKDIKTVINTKTGTLDKYEVHGVNYLTEGAFLPLVIKDDENSWAHKEKAFSNVIGKFTLMDKTRGAQFSGIIDGSNPESVRVIEDGEVRTIVEAIMEYEHSQLCLRYFLPKKGTELKVTAKVYWNEKMTMLKLTVPTVCKERFIGQTAYGSEKLLTNGDEMVSHKWNVVTGAGKAVSVINTGTYGSSCENGELRITCLRSPGYSAGKSDFSVRKPYIMEQDRFSPFIDQGEREFEFYLNASADTERHEKIEREAAAKNEKPMALSFFPTGLGKEVKSFALLDDKVISLAVFKRAEKSEKFVLRLFNPTAESRTTTLTIPSVDVKKTVSLAKYEFKSYAFDPTVKTFSEVDLMER